MPSVDINIEGREELVRKLRAMGPRCLRVARKVVKTALAPVLVQAQRDAPVMTGRLRASLGELVSSRKSSTTARVGTRRDFQYTDTAGVSVYSGRGKDRRKHLDQGAKQDKRTAQQYARGIEFGMSKDGRIRRKAGGAHMLEHAITQQTESIINNVALGLRHAVETNP